MNTIVRFAIRPALVALVMVSAAPSARAQETINSASVSGRVTDPQGGVVPGAPVTARQTRDQRHRRGDDGSGRPLPVSLPARSVRTRSRFISRASPTPTRHADAHGRLGVRSAGRARRRRPRHERHRDRRGDGARGGAQPDRRHGVAGRSADPADERPQLPRPGAARAGRVADQRRQHAALRRDVRGARRRAVGRQPAQLLEQLHRRRPVGQRRCGGAERHSVRRRRHRSVPGRHVGRAGGARTRARRLHQRRDEERHERRARRRLRLLRATTASTRPTR